MTNKKIVVFIKFNSWDEISERLSKEWIDSRMAIFMNYTLRSLKQQTSQDYMAFLTYDCKSEDLIKEALSKYEKLPDNVKFVEDFDSSVYSIIKGYDFLYIARIDSDDLFHKTYIQQLHDFKVKEDTEVLINQKGYLYDSVGNKLAHYFYRSTPFYTLIYNTKDYLNKKRYWFPNGHAGAITLKYEILGENNFAVVVHSSNIHTNFNDQRRGELITDPDEAAKILKGFM